MSNKKKGYLPLYRSIIDHWIWQDKPFAKGQAWIDLLLLANHKDSKFISGNKTIDGKRGCVYRSISFLSDRWGWSRTKTRAFLQQLEDEKMIKIFSTTHNTTINITNYQYYQGFEGISQSTDNTTKKQQKDSKKTAERQQKDTYNNVNNSNNEKNPPNPPSGGPPSPDQKGEDDEEDENILRFDRYGNVIQGTWDYMSSDQMTQEDLQENKD